jgi:hypothetical protein
MALSSHGEVHVFTHTGPAVPVTAPGTVARFTGGPAQPLALDGSGRLVRLATEVHRRCAALPPSVGLALLHGASETAATERLLGAQLGGTRLRQLAIGGAHMAVLAEDVGAIVGTGVGAVVGVGAASHGGSTVPATARSVSPQRIHSAIERAQAAMYGGPAPAAADAHPRTRCGEHLHATDARARAAEACSTSVLIRSNQTQSDAISRTCRSAHAPA